MGGVNGIYVTGRIFGAYFDLQETLNAFYHVLAQILTNYGVPALFYTDKRTVFEYKRKVKYKGQTNLEFLIEEIELIIKFDARYYISKQIKILDNCKSHNI